MGINKMNTIHTIKRKRSGCLVITNIECVVEYMPSTNDTMRQSGLKITNRDNVTENDSLYSVIK